MALVEQLFDGPIDIVGDVHGEIGALKLLMTQLGYDISGNHPDNRRLVFLGDLIDRGPDSPAVVELVMELVNNGRAQCIMGNHELNVALDRPMHGNGWIIQPNDKDPLEDNLHHVVNQPTAERYKAFFRNLPLALENDTLRIAHACWHDESVLALRADNDQSVVDLYYRYDEAYENFLASPEMVSAIDSVLSEYGSQLKNPDIQPPLLNVLGEKERAEQMMNPIRILTTSSMQIADTPFFGGGKWRMAERDPWWNDYEGDKTVVIGHFWRQFNPDDQRIGGVFGKDLFEGIAPHAWMGKKNNVYCVDYSVGQRHIERDNKAEDCTLPFYGKLAALRMPEQTVMHDDGSLISTYHSDT
ncbi:MAG: metallophosphoesterase [Gammaproteobacteria bacterium]|nr:MAG: metallophosphoesterase [Gammaproteobacteria bacterium]